MKTNILILSLILYFIINSSKIANCQNNLSFVIRDTIIYHSLKKDVIKVNLLILKKDSLHEYYLYGFDPLILLRDFFWNEDDICFSKGNLMAYLEDSEKHPFFDWQQFRLCKKPFPVKYEKTLKIKYVNYKYLERHKLVTKFIDTNCYFSNNLKINKKDTLIKKTVYIKVDELKYLKEGVYNLIIVYHFFDIWRSTIDDPNKYHVPVVNEYNDCIISNKVKVIVK